MRQSSNIEATPKSSDARPRLLCLAVVPLALLLGGCGLPPALMIASYAIEGFSLAATGKTIADHAISNAMKQDCALIRVVEGRQVCLEIFDAEGSPAMMASVPNGDNWNVGADYE